MLLPEGFADPGVVTAAAASLAVLVGVIHLLTRLNPGQHDSFPVVNGATKRQQAHHDYLTRARQLLVDGLAKFGGPFHISTPLGSRLILPASYASWVRACDGLSHSAIVEHEYLAWIPGFEGNRVIHEPNHIVIDVVRTKLSQNPESVGIMQRHLAEVLDHTWTETSEWHAVSLAETALDLISRTAASVFVGPVLARDDEWLQLTRTYTVNMFMGVRSLRSVASMLRPVAHWFVAECRACRSQMKLARRKITAELGRRESERVAANAAGNKPVAYADTLTWTATDSQRKRHAIDPAHAQLAYALASLHTTTQLLQQCFVDLCTHSDLIPLLRDEVEAALEHGGGWTLKALARMELLDSCIKETQRLKPGSLVNLERQAIHDVTLPSGVNLKKGTNIAVDSSIMWDPAVFPDPTVYDGHRFLRIRQSKPDASSSAAQLVSSSEHHFAFGWGKGICPGRFLVASEVKVILALILQQYDIRLRPGTPTQVIEYGFEMLSNPATELEVKRQRAN